jgi:hypothetical protein
MTTFVLSNINLQVSPGNFNASSKKILKVESVVMKPTRSVTLIKLKQPAEVLNDKSLQWHETLTLPAKFGTSFAFEIVSQHERGFKYNPEDIDSVMEGKIIIKRTDKDYCGWEVLLKDKKIGFLFANIEVHSK